MSMSIGLLSQVRLFEWNIEQVKAREGGHFYQHSEKKVSITKESGRYSSELMN